MALSSGAVPNVVRAALEYIALKYGPGPTESKACEILAHIRSRCDEHSSSEGETVRTRAPVTGESSEGRVLLVGGESPSPRVSAEEAPTPPRVVQEAPSCAVSPPFQSKTGSNWADVASSDDEEITASGG